MAPVLLAALAGALVGVLREPLGAHLRDPVVVVPGLAAVGVVLQLATGPVGGGAAGWLLAASLLSLLAFAVRNRRLVGMGVLATGLAMNAAVVVANGAMPVRAEAVVRAGVAEPAELALVDLGGGRRFERDDDRLVLLGDLVPVRRLGAVLSLGDLVVMAGVAAVACDLVRHAARGQGRWPGSALARAGRRARQRLPAELVGEDGVLGELRRVGDGLLHGQVLHGAGHVVHAEHGLGDGGRDGADGGERAGATLAGRGAGDGADEVLAGQRQQERTIELGEAADAVHEVERLPRRLGEVDARVEQDLLA